MDNAPSLSFTAGSDNLVSFGFSTTLTGLVTDLNNDGSQDIWWQRVSATQVKGFLDSGLTQLAVTLDLSAPGVIAAGATGTVTVTATLSDNLQHVLANGAQVSSLGNILVLATDTDNDVATGQVNLTVKDDIPTATADATSTAEDTAVTYNVITNGDGTSDQQGADAPATLVAATLAVPANGTVSFVAGGAITFTPANGIEGSAVINYTIRDADGDESSSTLTVTVATDSTPVVQTANNATVDEDGFLATRNLDEVPPAANETDSTESLTQTRTIVIDYGNVKDLPTTLDGSLVLVDTAGLDGQLQTLSGANVNFALESGVLVGRSTADNSEVIRIAILTGATASGTDVTYSYQVTLSQPVKHVDDESENSKLLTGVTFKATDDEGDFITGTVSVTIVDDVPTATNDTNLVDEAGTVTGNVLLGTADPGDEDVFGADQPAASAIKVVALSDGDGSSTDDYVLGSSTNQPDANNVVSITGLFGVLQLNVVTGEYTYTETVPTSSNQADVFSYTIRDADGDESTATLTVAIDDAPSVLDGVLTTNSNVQTQLITLSFVEKASSDFRDYLHAAAKIYDLSLQGQQGNIIQDVGFAIDGAANYNVTLEASTGTKAQITEFSLEGVTIQGSGNAALEKNNNDNTNADFTAITAIINPEDPPPAVLVQPKTVSTDGDATDNSLSDTSTNTINYYFGADGADTLTGSSDDDVLNGGGGLDTLDGGPGNDMLVYDSANNDVINGGSNPSDSATNDGFSQEDWDILRIDDGALALSQLGSSLDTNTLNSSNNVSVDLSGKAISNIEIILITEEAGASTPAVDPNDDVGTTLHITAADILAYTDVDHELWILGSPGDVVQLGSVNDWVDTDPNIQGVQGTSWQGTGVKCSRSIRAR